MSPTMSPIGLTILLTFAGISVGLDNEIAPVQLPQVSADIWNNIIPTPCESCQKAIEVLTVLFRNDKTFEALVTLAKLQCDVILLPTLRQKCKTTAEKLLRDLKEKISDSRKVCEDLKLCSKDPAPPGGDLSDLQQFLLSSFAEFEQLQNNASSETGSMIYDPITCQACKTAAAHLAKQLKSSIFQKVVVDTLTLACKVAPIPNKDCGEPFASVLRAGLNRLGDYFDDGNVCKILVWC